MKIILSVLAILVCVTVNAVSKDILAEAKRSISVIHYKSGNSEVTLQFTFQWNKAKDFAALALQKSPRYRVKTISLNGTRAPQPHAVMTYKVIRGIPASLLKKGRNELKVSWIQKRKKLPEKLNAYDIDIRLLGMDASELAFQTGPILGYAGEDFFTLTCRVNMPAEVVLRVNRKQYVSKPALLHSFKIKHLSPNTKYEYSLMAKLLSNTVSTGPHSLRTLTGGSKFKFAILGDSRTGPKDWAKVASAVSRAKPEFTVFVGDMVANGKNDFIWDEEFFQPAKEYFASIPFYAVIGNHEHNVPLFTKIFSTPGGGKNWSQRIGSVLMIGIDGSMDWKDGSKLYKWLEDLLAKSNAKFIFLVTHYPAWSSGNHGRLNKDGKPREIQSRMAREFLMPLMKKYKATAMFAGHDHIYERSEPPSEVSVIVTGGAGANRYGKAKNAEKQNPYSKAFASKLHYCLLEIDGNTCTMKVFTPDGTLLDQRNWNSKMKAISSTTSAVP